MNCDHIFYFKYTYLYIYVYNIFLLYVYVNRTKARKCTRAVLNFKRYTADKTVHVISNKMICKCPNIHYENYLFMWSLYINVIWLLFIFRLYQICELFGFKGLRYQIGSNISISVYHCAQPYTYMLSAPLQMKSYLWNLLIKTMLYFKKVHIRIKSRSEKIK